MDFTSAYLKRRRSAERALELLRSGTRVFLGSGCAEPRHLAHALAQAVGQLSDVEVLHVLGVSDDALPYPSYPESIRPRRFFMAAGARQAVAEGQGDFIPMYLSDVPRLLQEGPLQLDAALIQVSPPDQHGFVSLGVAVDVVKDAVEQSRVVIAQVNPLMPRTMGDTFVHISQLTALVEHEEPLVTYQVPAPDPTAARIAHQVAKLIKDGATIHLGLGRLPQAVLGQLSGHKNLGVHSDLLTEGYIDLVESGVINGANKTIYPRKIVASYCLGGPRLFSFVHNNPRVELYPVGVTNNPEVISKNRRMITVHEALEVDLTGQVCANVLGDVVYAGVGGMVDFLRGAAASPGGHSIVVLPSTGPGGQSRIRPVLSSGAGVVVTRSGVRTVVTEYGAAFLHGLSISERAVALIEVAHPQHREALLREARDNHLLSVTQVQVPLFKGVYPEKYERTLALKDGGQVALRPVRPADERLVQEFFYAMSDREVYYRFLHAIKAFPRKDMQRMVNIDYRREMTLVAVCGEFERQEVVGVARFVQGDNPAPEVDFAVAERMQGKGLGRAMMAALAEVAQELGYPGISAVALAENQSSLHILSSLGYAVTGTVSRGVTELVVHFDRPVQEPTVDLRYERYTPSPPGDQNLTRV